MCIKVFSESDLTENLQKFDVIADSFRRRRRL